MNTPEHPHTHRTRPLASLLLLDILRDPQARPIIIWAGATILFGAAIFHWMEGWNWLDAIYFAVVSLTTVGYGDLTPTRPITKVFTIFYILNGYGILLALIDTIREARMRRRLRDRWMPRRNRFRRESREVE